MSWTRVSGFAFRAWKVQDMSHPGAKRLNPLSQAQL
jgi:hypothetical protein